jgi:hypothetical protein
MRGRALASYHGISSLDGLSVPPHSPGPLGHATRGYHRVSTGSPSYHGIPGLDGLSVLPRDLGPRRRALGHVRRIPRVVTGSRSHNQDSGPRQALVHTTTTRVQALDGFTVAPRGSPVLQESQAAGRRGGTTFRSSQEAGRRGVIDRRRLVVVGAPPEPAFPRKRRVVLSGLPGTSRARLVAGTGICHAFLAPLGPPSRSSQAPGHRGRTSRLPSSSPPAFLSSQPPGRRRHLSRLPAGHHRRQVVVGSARAFLTVIAGAWSSPVSLADPFRSSQASSRRRHLSRLPSVATGRRRHLSRLPGTSQLVIAGARSSWAPLACLRGRRHLLPTFRSSYLSCPPVRSSQAPGRRGHHSPS